MPALNGFRSAFAESWRVWLKQRTRWTSSKVLDMSSRWVVMVSLAKALSALIASIYVVAVTQNSTVVTKYIPCRLDHVARASCQRPLQARHLNETVKVRSECV